MRKILYIEDAMESVVLLRAIFSDRDDLEIQVATTGVEARQQLAMHSYDLIILDLMLPDANGLELLKSIKQIHPNQMVVVMSAIAPIRTIEDEARRAGAHDIIEKPYSIRKIRELVVQLLDLDEEE